MYEAELAGRNFEADRDEATIIEAGSGYTIDSYSIEQLNQAREDHQTDLKVPRRPTWDASTSKEELDRNEKKDFLEWRRELAGLEENPMLVLSPFEKNLEVWKQLWRVVERSHLIVQIVDARNPLFFRCPDLEKYVKEVDKTKHCVLLLNKADLLSPEQRAAWSAWLTERKISFVYFSANAALEEEEGVAAVEVGPYSVEGDVLGREQLLDVFEKMGRGLCKVPAAEPVVIGFVGYPNVGKSSTINAICQEKKVGVASRPGKTRHFQTIKLDESLVLCDCPGLVFPSLSQSKSDMLCNGVLPIDQMRDHVDAIRLVCRRIPKRVLQAVYGVKLQTDDEIEQEAGVIGGAQAEEVASNAYVLSPEAFIVDFATVRGFHIKGGRVDESKAARMILKDIVTGKLLYSYCPPTDGGTSATPIYQPSEAAIDAMLAAETEV